MRRRLVVATARTPAGLFPVNLCRPMTAAASLIVVDLMGLEWVPDMEPRNVQMTDGEGLDPDVAAERYSDPRPKSVDRNISLNPLDLADT